MAVAELSLELHVSISLLRREKHVVGEETETAIAANAELVPLSELRAAEQRIREFERALGQKTLEIRSPTSSSTSTCLARRFERD